MWPFNLLHRNRHHHQDVPLIENHLGDKTPPPKVDPSPAEQIMTDMNHAQNTIETISGVNITLLQDLITESKGFENRLKSFVTELSDRSLGNSLDQFSGDVQAAYDRLKNTIGQSPDIIIRRFFIGQTHKIPAVLAFVDGLASNQMIDQDTINVLQAYENAQKMTDDIKTAHQIAHDSIISVGHATTENSWTTILTDIMGGNTVLFIEGCPEVLILDTVKYPARAIERPETERSVKGPQEAFNEVVLTQMNLIRRRIKSPKLHFDALTLGTVTKTTVIVAHIEELTNPEIVIGVKRRLNNLSLSTVQYDQEIAAALSSESRSLFPQYRSTERVDVVVRDLISGKVAILIDNTPFAVTVPVTLMDFYQTTEDYASNFWAGSLERIVRFIGLLIGLFLPPLYVALVSVNPSLVPTKLLLTIVGSSINIPFPPIFEVIIMWVIIEVLREAAIRLPKSLSTTLGTVGAIVVGTAIVKAGIVSDIMIVTITLTALGLFTAPVYDIAVPWRILFWFILFMSYLFGMYGITLASLIIVAHLASIENFGVPYLSPFGPISLRDLKDSWIRYPSKSMAKRPESLRTLRPVQRNPQSMPMDRPQLYTTQQERLHGDDENV